MKALLVALLMALAVSPLTAPFSVHIPVDVLGDVAWTSPKKAADDLKADGSPSVGVNTPLEDGAMPGPAVAPAPARAETLHSFPLRI